MRVHIIYIIHIIRTVSRDSRHFESPSPPPSPPPPRTRIYFLSRPPLILYMYINTHTTHWFPCGISCLHATVTYVCGGLITLYHAGDGFLYFIYIYYRVRARVVIYTARIPMGGCVCDARGAYIILCVRTVERESITEIRWPAINPTRKMLSLFFLYSLLFIFFFPIWRTPPTTRRRRSHTIWSSLPRSVAAAAEPLSASCCKKIQ